MKLKQCFKCTRYCYYENEDIYAEYPLYKLWVRNPDIETLCTNCQMIMSEGLEKRIKKDQNNGIDIMVATELAFLDQIQQFFYHMCQRVRRVGSTDYTPLKEDRKRFYLRGDQVWWEHLPPSPDNRIKIDVF